MLKLWTAAGRPLAWWLLLLGACARAGFDPAPPDATREDGYAVAQSDGGGGAGDSDRGDRVGGDWQAGDSATGDGAAGDGAGGDSASGDTMTGGDGAIAGDNAAPGDTFAGDSATGGEGVIVLVGSPPEWCCCVVV